MTLLLEVPSNRLPALSWVADIVLRQMLGLPVDIAPSQGTDIILSAEGRRLSITSIFPDLTVERSAWHLQMPALPLAEIDTVSAGLHEADIDSPLPVLFGAPRIDFSQTETRCEIDVLGSVFFMLSRFEEFVLPDRDRHDRFPGNASTAWKAGFLYRPLVDEYVELLWTMISRLWPGLARRHRQGSIKVSCDVDQPFDRVGTNPLALVRSLGGDIAKRHNPALATRRIMNFFAHRRGNLRFDPYYNFDWYIDRCEAHGRKAAFFFISDHSAGAIDGTYDIGEARVLTLLRKVDERGHEIGMHASYGTFRDPEQIGRERKRLEASCHKAQIRQEIVGNRQHYLRWDASQTPDHLSAAGFRYDTTGSFADLPGFRYGTSHPFEMWSWQQLSPMPMRQAPLVLMECSVLSKSYLGMGHSTQALELMSLLKNRAMRYGGDFTLLWHNSELLTAKDRRFFELMIE